MVPQIFLGRCRGKRFPSFFQRLGFFLPKKTATHVIWCHAVSVGEVKSLACFFPLLKQKYPSSCFLVTVVTVTGFQEAKRSIKGADLFLYLPLDFSYSMQRFVSHFTPSLFFLVEGDVWPNCLRVLKKHQVHTFLISAKMSQRSFSRWKFFPYFASKIFSQFDVICVQNEEFLQRFEEILKTRKSLYITGNLKLDFFPEKGRILPVGKGNVYVTVSCTHHEEEKKILQAIRSLPYKIFLAPRHPERFLQVAALLQQLAIPYVKISDNPSSFEGVKVILIDCMGMLNACYENSRVAILGGSFVPFIGGHNVLEPLYFGCLTLFGPHTYTQKQLVELVLNAGLGAHTTTEFLASDLSFWMNQSSFLQQKVKQFTEQLQGSSRATMQKISQYLEKNST